MITEYNISVNLLFDTAAKRDEWYDKIKTLLTNQKVALSAPKSIVVTKDESLISTRVSENI
jgi:hypothetical protein